MESSRWFTFVHKVWVVAIEEYTAQVNTSNEEGLRNYGKTEKMFRSNQLLFALNIFLPIFSLFKNKISKYRRFQVALAHSGALLFKKISEKYQMRPNVWWRNDDLIWLVLELFWILDDAELIQSANVSFRQRVLKQHSYNVNVKFNICQQTCSKLVQR